MALGDALARARALAALALLLSSIACGPAAPAACAQVPQRATPQTAPPAPRPQEAPPAESERPTSEPYSGDLSIFEAEDRIDAPGGRFNLAPTDDAAVVVQAWCRSGVSSHG